MQKKLLACQGKDTAKGNAQHKEKNIHTYRIEFTGKEKASFVVCSAQKYKTSW